MKDEDLVAEAMAGFASRGDGEKHKRGCRNKGAAGAVAAWETALVAPAEKKDATRSRKKYKKRVKDPEHKFPVQPRIIQVFHKPKSCVNQ
jgi:hypothetical protein